MLPLVRVIVLPSLVAEPLVPAAVWPIMVIFAVLLSVLIEVVLMLDAITKDEVSTTICVATVVITELHTVHATHESLDGIVNNVFKADGLLVPIEVIV